jgi:hypothetical protein
MFQLHGGTRGADRIPAYWAVHRNVPQIVFKPDWAREPRQAVEELPSTPDLFHFSRILAVLHH